jgi:uncharacterized protein YbjT (DUF2867 family)
VIGASGLIGGYVTARLTADGHHVVGVGRDIAAAGRRFPMVEWVRADLRGVDERQWRALLANTDAVVNCAGALQESPRDDMRAVQVGLVEALTRACRIRGVRRFVHISAAGIEDGDDPFRRAKRAAEEVLRSADLDWIILRPGLVLAPAAYGGGALLRGLAAFPFAVPVVNADAVVQPVSIDDLTEAVARGLTVTPSRFVCELVSAGDARLGDILLALRAWLGLPPARLLVFPGWTAALSARAADGLAWLGWRSPMRTASMRQLSTGVTGRSEDASTRLGLTPRTLSETLARWPRPAPRRRGR